MLRVISGFHKQCQLLLEQVQSHTPDILIQFVVKKITTVLYTELFTEHLNRQEDIKLKCICNRYNTLDGEHEICTDIYL